MNLVCNIWLIHVLISYLDKEENIPEKTGQKRSRKRSDGENNGIKKQSREGYY